MTTTNPQNLAGALCLRGLALGADPVTGEKLRGRAARTAEKIAGSIEEIRASGDLDGRPALIVTGRSDAILPLNHTSRAYFGLNRLVEGPGSKLRYYEVPNGQHLDVLNSLGAFGFDRFYIPLHHYYVQALDILFDHLKNGTPLPPSQVVRAPPRGKNGTPLPPSQVVRAPPRGVDADGEVPDIDEDTNLPPISAEPDAGDRITFAAGAVRIPE